MRPALSGSMVPLVLSSLTVQDGPSSYQSINVSALSAETGVWREWPCRVASLTLQGRAPVVTQSRDALQAAGPSAHGPVLCALCLWHLARPGLLRVSAGKAGCCCWG